MEQDGSQLEEETALSAINSLAAFSPVTLPQAATIMSMPAITSSIHTLANA
jgi:hypothetical protein